MRFLRLSLTAVALCGALAPVSGRDTIIGPLYSLRLGKEGKIKGEDLRLTFLAVEEDSRCPKDVECISEGNARVRLMARNSKGACAEFVMNTNAATKEYVFGKYRIWLNGLFPQPTAGESKPRAYEVVLSIEKMKK